MCGLAGNTTNDGYRKHKNEDRTKGSTRKAPRNGGRDSYMSEMEGRMRLDSKVIFVFSAAALGYPKYDRGEHQPDVLGDVAVPVVLVHLGVVVHNVFEDQDALLGGKGWEGTRVRRVYRTRGLRKERKEGGFRRNAETRQKKKNHSRRFQRDRQPSKQN